MRRIANAVLALTVAIHSTPMLVFAQASATLSGTARNSSGQALANVATQLRDVDTGQLIGKTISSTAGRFSFLGLSAASYVVEVVNVAGQVVGTSAVTAVADGANVAVAVQAAGGVEEAGGGGMNMALLLTALAASIGVAALVVAVNRDEASPSR